MEPLFTHTIDGSNLVEVDVALGARSGAIAEQWAGLVRSGLNRSDAELPELMGGEIHALLRELSGSPEVPGGQAPATKTAPNLTQRWPAAREMFMAWQVLRRLVLEHVVAELGRELRGEEVVALNARFDQLMRDRLGSAIDGRIDELRTASEAQSKHLSYLSHDLRGSLNGIILMLEVLRRELEGKPEFEESLSDLLLMRKSVMESVQMMERHSLAERLRRGRVDINLRSVALRGVVEQVVANLSRPAKEKGLSVVAEVPESQLVYSDREVLRIILHELLDNAVKYSTRGVIHIRTGKSGPNCLLFVTDQGLGMSNEKLQQFLDPIRRMELRDPGMGLTITQYAAKLLSARVEGESVPGQGTSMRLILPPDLRAGEMAHR